MRSGLGTLLFGSGEMSNVEPNTLPIFDYQNLALTV